MQDSEFRREILQNSLVYLGAGTDWSVIRQTLGVVHSYVLLDLMHCPNDVEASIERGIQVDGPGHLTRRIHHIHFDVSQEMEHLLRLAPPNFLRERRSPWSKPSYRGSWSLMEGSDGRRFSILYLNMEAIEAVWALYAPLHLSPRILAFDDNITGGVQCWNGFGEGYMHLIRQCGFDWPEILIVGRDHFNFRGAAHGHYQLLCRDSAHESMHGQERLVFVRHAYWTARMRR